MWSVTVLWAGLRRIGYFLMGMRIEWLLVETLAIDFLKLPYWLISREAVRMGTVPATSKHAVEVFLKFYFERRWRALPRRTSSILLFMTFFKYESWFDWEFIGVGAWLVWILTARFTSVRSSSSVFTSVVRLSSRLVLIF